MAYNKGVVTMDKVMTGAQKTLYSDMSTYRKLFTYRVPTTTDRVVVEAPCR